MKWNVKLQVARISKELSRQEAADLIGVNKLTYGRWERGDNLPLLAIQKVIEEKLEYKIFGGNSDDGQDIEADGYSKG